LADKLLGDVVIVDVEDAKACKDAVSTRRTSSGLPPDSAVRDVLMYVSPTVSVVTGWAAAVLDGQARYYQRRWVLGRTLKTLRQRLDNPGASPDHKIEIRTKIQALEAKYAESEVARATAIFDEKTEHVR
jgi:hypothetical protein